MKPETKFRQKVDAALKKLPNIASFSIQQRTIKGDPDKILCVNGKFVALELKSVAGKPTELQGYKLELIRKAGGEAFLVYPENWEPTLKFIKALAMEGNDNDRTNVSGSRNDPPGACY